MKLYFHELKKCLLKTGCLQTLTKSANDCQTFQKHLRKKIPAHQIAMSKSLLVGFRVDEKEIVRMIQEEVEPKSLSGMKTVFQYVTEKVKYVWKAVKTFCTGNTSKTNSAKYLQMMESEEEEQENKEEEGQLRSSGIDIKFNCA